MAIESKRAESPPPLPPLELLPTATGEACRVVSVARRNLPSLASTLALSDRETRSDRLTTGPMISLGYDATTGILQAMFPSREQHQAFCRRAARQACAQRCLPLSRYFIEEGGIGGEIRMLDIMRKGALATAALIEREGGDAEAHRRGVLALSLSCEARKNAYAKAMASMERVFSKRSDFDVSECFRAFEEAVALGPEDFTTYLYVLAFVPCFSVMCPSKAKSIARGAHEASPELTFATLILKLYYNRTEAFIHLLIELFPSDLALYETLRKNELGDFHAQEEKCRRLFAHYLGEGLQKMREGDLKEAYGAFSKAGNYHLSDPRPYLYQALIDLKGGDIPSVYKLMGKLGCLITCKEDLDRVKSHFFVEKRLLTEEHPEGPFQEREYRERLVLLALIKAWESKNPDRINAFFLAIADYLRKHDADVLWASCALDIARERLTSFMDDKLKQNFFGFPYVLWLKLDKREDLVCWTEEEKEERFFIVEGEEGIVFSPTFIIRSAEKKRVSLTIDAESLEMEESLSLSLWEELFYEQYTYASLLMAEPAEQERWRRLLTSSENKIPEVFMAWDLVLEGRYREAKEKLALFWGRFPQLLKEGLHPMGVCKAAQTQALANREGLAYEMARGRSKLPFVEEVIDCASYLLAREGLPVPFVVPEDNLSDTSYALLADLYLGNRLEESREAHQERLQKLLFPTGKDLRVKCEPEVGGEERRSGWLLASTHQANEKMRHEIQRRLELNTASLKKSREVAQESPQYEVDFRENHPDFVAYVTQNKILIKDFINNPQKVEREVRARFPRVAKNALDKFFVELASKAAHERAMRELKAASEKPERDPDKRFWQLVRLTADLIDRAGKPRSIASHDLVLSNEAEARFVMQLIFEWSQHQEGHTMSEEFMRYFRGPEIHVWGLGPRISHFHAGVVVEAKPDGENKPVPVHLYFAR